MYCSGSGFPGGSLYNFIQMKTFDELYLHIISASKSFSGSQEVDPNGKS
jgi:hypothetical protein